MCLDDLITVILYIREDLICFKKQTPSIWYNLATLNYVCCKLEDSFYHFNISQYHTNISERFFPSSYFVDISVLLYSTHFIILSNSLIKLDKSITIFCPYLWKGSESNTWRCCTTAAWRWSWDALPPPAGCPRAVQSAGPETWGWGWRCCGWCSWPETPSLSANPWGGVRVQSLGNMTRNFWNHFSDGMKLYTEKCDTDNLS